MARVQYKPEPTVHNIFIQELSMREHNMGERVWKAWDMAWNNGEVNALDDVLAPDYQRAGLLVQNDLNREGMKSLILKVREAFPDLYTSINQCVEDADSLAILWKSVGTHMDDFYGVPPTGKCVTISGASFFTKREGMIVKELETWNSRDLLSALGIISLPSTTDNED